MRAHTSHILALRTGIGIPALLVAVGLLSGCDQGYPEDLVYPVRSDAIATRLPTTTPTHLDSPGQLDHLIVEFHMLGGDIVDPSLSEAKAEIKKLHEDGKKDTAGTKNEDNQKKIAALEKRISKWEGPWSKVRPKLQEELDKLFGTPASPKVDIGTEVIRTLGLDPAALAEGSRYYRQQCLHCHGLTGDGRGPTGPWVNPHPRDYRRGYFKFTSTKGGNDRKPRARGPDAHASRRHRQQLDAFVWTAPRRAARKDGQLRDSPLHSRRDGGGHHPRLAGVFDEEKAEFDLTQLEGGSLHAQVAASVGTIGDRWVASSANGIEPAKFPFSRNDMAGSITRGHKLFTAPGAASCVSCHADFGRQFSYRWDEWGTIVRPADLTGGIYRGGRRPIDLYYRIHSGILGAGMPAFSKENGGTLETNDVWDLVNFLKALPYPSMLPPEVRTAVYPQ